MYGRRRQNRKRLYRKCKIENNTNSVKPLQQEEKKTIATQNITELYKTVLLREPDPKGLKYWVQKNINGMSIEEIKNSFMKIIATQNITELYKTVLLREPDPKGLKYWVQKHINGMSIEEIKNSFMKTIDSQNITENNPDYK